MNNILYKINGIEIDEKLFNYYKEMVIKKGERNKGRRNKLDDSDENEADVVSYAKYEVFKRAVLLELAEKNETKITEADLEQKLYKITLEYSSIDEFKEAISSLTIGYNRYLTLIAEDLKIEKFLRDEFNPENYSVDISDVVSYYEKNKEKYATVSQVRVSHILKKIDADDSENVRDTFDELIAIKHMKKPFEELAETFSDCPSAQNGGDLGFLKRGMMPVDFEDIAFRLRVNDVSSVLKTPLGLHVIKCTEKITGFDAVKDDIEHYLINEKIMNDIELYVQDKISEAYVGTE